MLGCFYFRVAVKLNFHIDVEHVRLPKYMLINCVAYLKRGIFRKIT